ncbi:MAG: DUF134 domain-containing protein [Candidatus Margulisbacteria bacterium]|nr:DUF134 domain-containing protein [Candidatus Margulisiibacteriota bacterium]
MSPFQRKKRFCREFSGASFYKPSGIPLSRLPITILDLDEMEAMHLCDFEDLNQTEAAQRMNISTGTLQRLLYSGRKKLIDAIYTSKAIKIDRHEDIEELKGGE